MVHGLLWLVGWETKSHAHELFVTPTARLIHPKHLLRGRHIVNFTLWFGSHVLFTKIDFTNQGVPVSNAGGLIAQACLLSSDPLQDIFTLSHTFPASKQPSSCQLWVCPDWQQCCETGYHHKEYWLDWQGHSALPAVHILHLPG
jgi:hypothetical protein